MTVQVSTQPAVHCRSMQMLVGVLLACTALTICTMAGTKMQWTSAPLLAAAAAAAVLATAQKYQIQVSIKCEVDKLVLLLPSR